MLLRVPEDMRAFLLLILYAAWTMLAFASEDPKAKDTTGTVTGLSIPRFASLKSSQVNIRTGPGKRYPIDWVIVRKGMPVEIIAEHDIWRKIKDWQGTEGWVHHAMLSGRRSVLITGQNVILRKKPAADAAPVIKLAPMIAAFVERCTNDWCQVETDNFKGWLMIKDIWGIKTGEVF
jgi:SH3-like domain-containing protein